MKTAKRLIIYGRVQGVFFRESMCRQAAELGVTGWVRNRRDGSVEAMVQGDEAAVERMIDWARSGPAYAQVERVEIEPGSGEYDRFERLGTV
jgi:acylphosphatase